MATNHKVPNAQSLYTLCFSGKQASIRFIVILVNATNIPIRADIKNKIPATTARNSMEYFRQKPQILYRTNKTKKCIKRFI